MFIKKCLKSAWYERNEPKHSELSMGEQLLDSLRPSRSEGTGHLTRRPQEASFWISDCFCTLKEAERTSVLSPPNCSSHSTPRSFSSPNPCLACPFTNHIRCFTRPRAQPPPQHYHPARSHSRCPGTLPLHPPWLHPVPLLISPQKKQPDQFS